MPDTGETHFGFRTVDLADKQGMVDEVFQRVARRYDLMNDLMSGGLHRVWKDAMVAMLNPPRSGRYAVVDVAGGTGDVAFRIAEAGGPDTARQPSATSTPTCSPSGMSGRWRAGSTASSGSPPAMPRRCRSPIAARMPAPSPSASATCRGSTSRSREFHRVLRPGGRFLCLEFSTVDVPGLDRLYDLYSFNVIPALGRAVAGDADSYRYLVELIRRFPRPQAFADMIAAAGFRRTSFRLLTGGVVALHSAWRL